MRLIDRFGLAEFYARRTEVVMASKFYVILVEDCVACEGTGIVTDPMWEELLRVNPKPTADEIDAWFAECGETPSEETVCVECEGKGFMERRVLLSRALERIADDQRAALGGGVR